MSVAAIARVSEEVGKIVIGFLEESAGASVPLSQAQPLPEPTKTRKKVKVGLKDDNKRVLKLSDAVECVESVLNGKDTGKFIRDAIGSAFTQFLSPSGLNQNYDVDSWQDFIAKPITDCMRKKVLPQTSKRKSVTYTYSKREI